jgi:hypothetical protein
MSSCFFQECHEIMDAHFLSPGGGKSYVSDDARRTVINDLKRKALENKPLGQGAAA